MDRARYRHCLVQDSDSNLFFCKHGARDGGSIPSPATTYLPCVE